MEPYRPYVDKIVMAIYDTNPSVQELTTELKRALLEIPVLDVTIQGKRSPLMIAVSQTVSSLVKCFRGDCRKVIYPDL